jgi:predicted N-acetyltransferase YhbS
VDLRPATEADFLQLPAFRCANADEWWTADAEAIVTAGLASLARSDQEYAVFVAHDGQGVVVGVIGCAPLANRNDALEVQILAVEPCWRRQYIGLNLKWTALEMAKTRGMELVVSSVHEDNQAMRLLNEKLLAEAEPDDEDPHELSTVVRIDPA